MNACLTSQRASELSSRFRHNHGFDSVTVEDFKESRFHVLRSCLIFTLRHSKVDTLKRDVLIDVGRALCTYQTCLASQFDIPFVMSVLTCACGYDRSQGCPEREPVSSNAGYS